MPGRRCAAALRAMTVLGVFWGAMAGPAAATPYDNVPVGDPIEEELRILDTYGTAPLHGRIKLPHLNTRPIQSIELQGIGPAPDSLDLARAISIARLERF